MKTSVICISVVIVSSVSSYLHMVYSADRIAILFGYAVSLGILPFLFGGTLGCIGLLFIGRGLIEGLKVYWWIPILCSIVSLVPIAFVIWRMSQPGN
jgi:hypothetical protein